MWIVLLGRVLACQRLCLDVGINPRPWRRRCARTPSVVVTAVIRAAGPGSGDRRVPCERLGSEGHGCAGRLSRVGTGLAESFLAKRLGMLPLGQQRLPRPVLRLVMAQILDWVEPKAGTELGQERHRFVAIQLPQRPLRRSTVHPEHSWST